MTPFQFGALGALSGYQIAATAAVEARIAETERRAEEAVKAREQLNRSATKLLLLSKEIAEASARGAPALGTVYCLGTYFRWICDRFEISEESFESLADKERFHEMRKEVLRTLAQAEGKLSDHQRQQLDRIVHLGLLERSMPSFLAWQRALEKARWAGFLLTGWGGIRLGLAYGLCIAVPGLFLGQTIVVMGLVAGVAAPFTRLFAVDSANAALKAIDVQVGSRTRLSDIARTRDAWAAEVGTLLPVAERTARQVEEAFEALRAEAKRGQSEQAAILLAP